MTSPVVAGETMRFGDDAVRDVYRNVFMTLWNVHSFFTTYAEVDGWQPSKTQETPPSDNVLDRWLLARLNACINEITESADRYELNRATRPLRELIDDLSNWYVRRSRRRFWKSQDDGDKQAAYATLHYALVRVAQLLAPWSPFLPDKLWRDLTDGMDLPVSVHLSDWPEAGAVDMGLLDEMTVLRKLITGGLEIRAKAGIKVRQPLAAATLEWSDELSTDLLAIAQEELNVKKVHFNKLSEAGASGVRLDAVLTPELKREGMIRDVVRQVQNLRKTSGLAVDDRIELSLATDDSDLQQAITDHEPTIMAEVLAISMADSELEHSVAAKVDGQELMISLRKA
jgi:isoleucyl-tRNA synthetase